MEECKEVAHLMQTDRHQFNIYALNPQQINWVIKSWLLKYLYGLVSSLP